MTPRRHPLSVACWDTPPLPIAFWVTPTPQHYLPATTVANGKCISDLLVQVNVGICLPKMIMQKIII